jgi:hemoglobin-like flavoprotein
MTPENIALVKSSWQQVLPIQKAAAELFYGRLFELDTSLRPLFKGDMAEQGRKLMTMINTVVMSLDRLEPLLGAVEDLGRRHVGYGVTEAHYDTVGSALLWTLGQGLGAQFTPPVEAAWTEAYTTLASVMKQAAYTPA